MNFALIEHLDIRAIQKEIGKRESLFKFDSRKHLKSHQHTESIYLRAASPLPGENVGDTENVVDLYATSFPITMTFLNAFAKRRDAKLFTVVVTKLKPYCEVLPHIDEGTAYLTKDRYHIVVNSEGSVMECDGEKSIWSEGQLWWFNNKKMHAAYNNSGKGRIHVIFDLKPLHLGGVAE